MNSSTAARPDVADTSLPTCAGAGLKDSFWVQFYLGPVGGCQRWQGLSSSLRPSRRRRADLALDRSNRACHSLDDERQLLVGGDEGRSYKGLISCISIDRGLCRVHDQAARQSLHVYAPGDAEVGIEERLAVTRIDVVDAKEKPPSPNLPDHVATPERVLELAPNNVRLRADALDQSVCLDIGEHRVSHRAGQRRA